MSRDDDVNGGRAVAKTTGRCVSVCIQLCYGSHRELFLHTAQSGLRIAQGVRSRMPADLRARVCKVHSKPSSVPRPHLPSL